MKKIVFILFFTLNFSFTHAQLKQEYQSVVVDFIAAIKNKKKEPLLNLISFPFERQYPIPDIKNKTEFLKRYKEVFDDSLVKMIVNSKPATDWSDVGWRGIMLFNGVLWLDYDGSLICVNYQSNFERKTKEELIETEKSSLYISIREFKSPAHILATSKYTIRIDDLGNGNYRYASWSINNKMSEKPDIVIEKGECIMEGNGGNHRYEFKNGDYLYECSIIVMGEDDSPPALLTIYKESKEILSQAAKIIKH